MVQLIGEEFPIGSGIYLPLTLNGTLTLDGRPVVAGDVVSSEEINAGLFRYQGATDASSDPPFSIYDEFPFNVVTGSDQVAQMLTNAFASTFAGLSQFVGGIADQLLPFLGGGSDETEDLFSDGPTSGGSSTGGSENNQLFTKILEGFGIIGFGGCCIHWATSRYKTGRLGQGASPCSRQYSHLSPPCQTPCVRPVCVLLAMNRTRQRKLHGIIIPLH